MTSCATRGAIARVAQDAYGRLLGKIAAYTRDISTAEDYLAEALMVAMERWPRDGVPNAPEGWLLTTARRRAIDAARRRKTAQEASHTLAISAMEKVSEREAQGDALPDSRCNMLFVCAHPAISPSIHSPLMLQTVLGLKTKEIAPLFLARPQTLAQQLVRAKSKIRAASISFEIPDREEMESRLPPVLDAIYAVFVAGLNLRKVSVMDEAIFLARICASGLGHGSIKALLSLCLYQRTRFGADRSVEGDYIPFSEQSPTHWDHDRIEEAE